MRVIPPTVPVDLINDFATLHPGPSLSTLYRNAKIPFFQKNFISRDAAAATRVDPSRSTLLLLIAPLNSIFVRFRIPGKEISPWPIQPKLKNALVRQ